MPADNDKSPEGDSQAAPKANAPARTASPYVRAWRALKRCCGRRPAGLGLWLAASPLVAIIAVLIYACAESFDTSTSNSNFGSVLSTGMAVSIAALISGVLTGFLFGLPRTREEQKTTGLLATNTNLEQISDWLTKILVGLGLTQLGKIAHGVESLADGIAPGLGGGTSGTTIATSILIYSAVDGFLIGYLWARIVLSKRLREAAKDLLENLRVGDDIGGKRDKATVDPPLMPPETLKAEADVAPPSGL